MDRQSTAGSASWLPYIYISIYIWIFSERIRKVLEAGTSIQEEDLAMENEIIEIKNSMNGFLQKNRYG